MTTATKKRPTDRKQDKSKTPTEFWFDVEGEHRRLYAIRPNEAGKLLFYLDRNEVLEMSFRQPCSDETGWPQHTPDLAPADVQTIAKSKTLKGIFHVSTVSGGSFGAYMLRRGYTAAERRTVPNDCEEREPTRADMAGKAGPEPDAGKLAAKRKERPIKEHLRDPDKMLIFKVMDACPKLDARTRNNTVKHWDVFLPAWRNSESDYTIAEKLKRPRKTIERRRKTIEAEVLDGLPIAGLKYDLSVFRAAMREQESARETGFTAYKGALLGSMNPNED